MVSRRELAWLLADPRTWNSSVAFVQTGVSVIELSRIQNVFAQKRARRPAKREMLALQTDQSYGIEHQKREPKSRIESYSLNSNPGVRRYPLAEVSSEVKCERISLRLNELPKTRNHWGDRYVGHAHNTDEIPPRAVQGSRGRENEWHSSWLLALPWSN